MLNPLSALAGGDLYPMGKLLTAGCPRCESPAPALQIKGDLFRCTVCGTSGGPVQYLLARGTGVLEAARRLGISLVPPERIVRLLRIARAEFERALWRTPHSPAASLLKKRRISRLTAACFHLGATPPQGELTRHLLERGFTLGELCEAGIVRKRGNAYTEHLRDRLVFPLVDAAGRTVGFAGRALKEDRLKYLNTPASPVGSRSEILFGLPQAIPHLRKRREAWVVEGYFDVLACHQAGIRWVVAPCGTALSTRQALILRRYVERVVLIYDGDASGEAVERASRSLRRVGMSVLCARLPGGTDPDEIVVNEGPEALVRIAQEAKEVSHVD